MFKIATLTYPQDRQDSLAHDDLPEAFGPIVFHYWPGLTFNEIEDTACLGAVPDLLCGVRRAARLMLRSDVPGEAPHELALFVFVGHDQIAVYSRLRGADTRERAIKFGTLAIQHISGSMTATLDPAEIAFRALQKTRPADAA